jgi:xanthine dehydrogenase accessory factor
MKEIEDIIKRYNQTDWATEKTALATVVRVEESAYRRIGARMYVSSNGNWVGGISGGCLEGDALKRAQIAIAKNKSSIVIYDTMQDDSHQIGVGLGCNGRIDVMFTPIDPKNEANRIELLKKIQGQRQSTILLQIVATDHSDKDALGYIVTQEEVEVLCTRFELDKKALSKSIKEVKDRKRSKIFAISSKTGENFDVLIELIRPKIKLILVGDNYDVNAFAGIGHKMGWAVQLLGKKGKFDRSIAALAEKIFTYEDLHDITIDEHTAIVLMSHDYKTDLRLLQHFSMLNVPYIGLLGPKKRTLKMQGELKTAGSTLNLETMTNLYSPVGLDIGAETPEEIALSIASEILASMRKGKGASLRKKKGPIHEREK